MAGKSHLTNASPAGKNRVVHPAAVTPWVKRRQEVCGPEPACARETIAPTSIAVAAADLVPHKGRQPAQTRDRGRVCGRCRGAAPAHADHGTCVDVGEPAAADAAHTRDRSRGDTRASRPLRVPRRRPSDGPRVRGARESRVQGAGGRRACPWQGPHGLSPGRDGMLAPAPGRTSPVAPARARSPATARRAPQLPGTSCAHHRPGARLRDKRRPRDQPRATGVEGHPVAAVTQPLDWGAQEVRRQRPPPGSPPPPGGRGWIPKPGTAATRPRGRPPGGDRALQTRTAPGLEALSEPDGLHGAGGGRPGRRAHPALAPLTALIAGQTVRCVLEAALRTCFGRLDQTGARRCVHLRVGEPRMLTRLRRWRPAGGRRPDGAGEPGA